MHLERALSTAEGGGRPHVAKVLAAALARALRATGAPDHDPRWQRVTAHAGSAGG